MVWLSGHPINRDERIGNKNYLRVASGAPGEAGVIQPVKVRHRKGVANRLLASVASASVTSGAKRTQQSCGVGYRATKYTKSPEVETVGCVEDNMGQPVCEAKPTRTRSKTPSRTKGACRNLGDLVFDRASISAHRSAAGRRGAEAADERRREVGQVRSTDEVREQGRVSRLRRSGWREGAWPREVPCRGTRPWRSPGTGVSQSPTRPRSGNVSVPNANGHPDTRHVIPEARARCGKAARRDPCGGWAAMPIPTATVASNKCEQIRISARTKRTH